ncbi:MULTISPECIES: hypothetical protein [Olivibacter]|jgi:pyrroloquinoline quinone (PQQ) biosynthesis protein C|uniref:Uncharacterized protein n=3 Tax=Sphingobacteriaceae TaxID=84566 RepID=F4CAN8_SPHS2|nr:MULTISPECIES: hypothetical protein [Olivibacter]MCL4637420.1 hypothetical protein [Olivibacter sp. UJ_SKK_5.1]MDM8178023.1 hypothetical protein [Olivibacter sp. 47]MDX3916457.1 hypothetical protein [Pseudosphingobacterium sp.]QEK99327.1 hypothetical protein FKG96_00470 [Olivibacter sp. LS-1]
MLKRDSLTAQMQQLSHTLAKVKRLIIEDHEPKALEEVIYTLEHYYGTSQKALVAISTDVFMDQIREQAYKAEELNMLAAFLDELAGLNDDEETRKNLWAKVIALYDFIEEEFQTLSFDHIARRNILVRALGME